MISLKTISAVKFSLVAPCPHIPTMVRCWLAIIMERLAGQPYEVYIQDYILKPLQMSQAVSTNRWS
jgi:Beta-lactamase